MNRYIVEIYGLPEENELTSFKKKDGIVYLTFNHSRVISKIEESALVDMFVVKGLPEDYHMLYFSLNKGVYKIFFSEK